MQTIWPDYYGGHMFGCTGVLIGADPHGMLPVSAHVAIRRRPGGGGAPPGSAGGGAPGRRQRPCQTGGRLSRKASMPSSASRASMLRVMTSLA